MPLTLSGRRVARDTTDHPNLIDIAVGLSRTPRFAGQTTRWFSVLDHTMFGLYLIEADPFAYRYDPKWWLLHDAHESMTGDVTTDLKTAELRDVQDELDRRIFRAFYPRWDRSAEPAHSRIKDLDNRCLRAEARVLKNGANIGGAPIPGDVEILQDKLYEPKSLRDIIPTGAMGVPPMRVNQEKHPLVRQYVSRMIELL